MSVGRILVVDDDRRFRELVTLMLTTDGYAVQEVSDGVDALAAYRQQRPDVILMDILMPQKEGLETIRELRGIDPNVKIIAMSVSGERRGGHLDIAVRFGAICALRKPFARSELLAVVAEVIGA
jgi:two-component system chemotaxis response regulator CheY